MSLRINIHIFFSALKDLSSSDISTYPSIYSPQYGNLGFQVGRNSKLDELLIKNQPVDNFLKHFFFYNDAQFLTAPNYVYLQIQFNESAVKD